MKATPAEIIIFGSMPSIHPDFEYDIFISYRQKDNKRDGWVTEFVASLKAELDATLKNPVSIYFDENPHDGLLETHQVDASLARKLKCIVFIPIVSQTYCDPSSFAWQHELLPFIRIASEDSLGINITLANGNVASRVLPIQIHDLDAADRLAIESALSGPLRAIPFIYAAPGVNRPLRVNEEHPENNKNKASYRDQINKVANALKEIGTAVLKQENARDDDDATASSEKQNSNHQRSGTSPWGKVNIAAAVLLLVVVVGYYLFRSGPALDPSRASIGVIPFRNNTGDASMNHYGVGIASEVSTQLGLTKQFDFISSLQATIQYQQSDKSPETIGQELGVTHILTGMYQTAGYNIQVMVELVDVNGKVIWSIPYKTRYNDIFDVQASIAKRVMDKFAVKNVAETSVSTPNLEAYAHYMKGLDIALKSNRPEDRMKAIAEYQQAIALDSSFIEPWWGIVEEYCYYYFHYGEEAKLTLQMVEPYMDYVKENFPDDWKKKSVMGTYEYWALAHFQKGLDLFLEALQDAPQEGGNHSMAAAIYRRQLKLDRALYHISVSLKQNPGGVIYWNELVGLTSINGDYDNAMKAASMIYSLNESLDSHLYRLRLWDGSLDQLPEPIKERHRFEFSCDMLLLKRDFKGLLSFLETSRPDSALPAHIRLYYGVVGNYLLKRDDRVRKLGAEYLALKDWQPQHKWIVLAILGKEVDFNAQFDGQERNVAEDLTEQWGLEREWLNYHIFSGDYPEAIKRLKQVNEHFPQVGDYGWLNLPIYDRIKKDYPAFAEAVSQLKLPPRIMDSKIIKM